MSFAPARGSPAGLADAPARPTCSWLVRPGSAHPERHSQRRAGDVRRAAAVGELAADRTPEGARPRERSDLRALALIVRRSASPASTVDLTRPIPQRLLRTPQLSRELRNRPTTGPQQTDRLSPELLRIRRSWHRQTSSPVGQSAQRLSRTSWLSVTRTRCDGDLSPASATTSRHRTLDTAGSPQPSRWDARGKSVRLCRRAIPSTGVEHTGR